MMQWYRTSWSEVVKTLESNIYSGLDGDEIISKREKHGANRILIPKTKGLFSIIMEQIKEPWIILLFLCLIIFIVFFQVLLSIITLIVIVISIVCVSIEKNNNEKSIKQLESLNTGLARVVRDDRTLKIPFEQLVVGDIVIVGKGDGIPADLRVVESEELKVNETSVTGEKFIAEKYETKIEDNYIPLSEMKNMLFKSSVVVDGSGTGIVVATGMNTQIANMVKLLFAEKDESVRVGEKLHGIINYLSVFTIVLLIIDITLKVVGKENINQIIYFSAKFILNSIPQGTISIVFLISIFLLRIMKKNSVELKDLSILEKVASISVICTDKVGSFSKNKMEVAKVFTNGNFLEVVSDNVVGSYKEGDLENLQRLLHVGLLCNDTQVYINRQATTKEDLMESAIIKFSMANGLDKRSLDKKHERVLYIPYDSDRKLLTTINSVDEYYRANIKGSVESILGKCTHIMKSGVEVDITEEELNAIKRAGIKMSADCLSVVAFAYRSFNYEPSLKENIESNLVFVGLLGFENKLKADAVGAISRSEGLNVKPVIITEDNKLTAFAVGKRMKLVSRLTEIITGVEIDNMSSEEFDRIGDKIRIFSKITSSHKVKMIKSLKSYGYRTAIIGSKLTDLPAIRISDVGITTSSSKIVKKMSDIIIKEVGFMNILDLLEDSRKMFNILKKVIVYIISCTLGMIMYSFLMLAWRYDLPLLNIEGFFFYNILITISSFALAIQYKNEETDCDEYGMNKELIKGNKIFIFLNGLLIGIIGFLVFVLTYSKGLNFAQITSFSALNIYVVLYSVSFSKSKIIKNVLSNLVLFLCIFLQFIVLALLGGIQIFMNIEYWKVILPLVVICTLVSMFNKYEYID